MKNLPFRFYGVTLEMTSSSLTENLMARDDFTPYIPKVSKASFLPISFSLSGFCGSSPETAFLYCAQT